MNIGVLLSGNGVYDGSEIQEAVFSLLAIEEAGGKAICFAPNKNQHHVINHLTGDEMDESRNTMVEAARIARGNIRDINEVDVNDIDALVIPGGFGAAKNLTSWAFHGPEGSIDEDVQRIILNAVKAKKPIAALCMGPTVVAKALENSNFSTKMTVGTTEEPSPYNIREVSDGMAKLGVNSVMKTVREIEVDSEHNIVTAPCYMMEASITEIRDNIKNAVDEMVKLVNSK